MIDKERKLISIITVNFNNKTGLLSTIKSVERQDYSLFEYIIIDGDSSDGSKEVIHKYSEKITYWVSEMDKGIYHAMNKGIAKASGDYLVFLNSGDSLCDPEVVQRCYDFMVQNPGADIYYGDMFLVNDINNPKRHLCQHPSRLGLSYFKRDTINHQASLIKASQFKEFGLYPEQYRLAADYWLFLKSLLHNKQYKYLGFPLVDYDFSGISFTGNDLYRKEKEAIWKSLVPSCVEEILEENDAYRKLMAYKLVRTAIRLNNKYQHLKRG